MDGDDEETCDVDGEEAMWKLMRELPPFSLDGVPRVTANVHADLKVQLSYLANCYGISMVIISGFVFPRSDAFLI